MRGLGHSTLLRGTVLVAVAFAVLLLAWPTATAGDRRVDAQVSIATSSPAHHRKAMAIQALVKLNNGNARRAITGMAKHADDATALVAIAALCREDFRGARATLIDIAEDTDRSEAVRCTALAACLELEATDGHDWTEVESWVEDTVDGEDEMDAMAEAVKAKRFSKAVK